MIRLSQQELEICYILSRIFNYYTSYVEILGDIEHDLEFYKNGFFPEYAYLVGKEECFALFRVRRKYKQVAREIKTIKSDFTQKDLERLFPIVALYCMKTPLFYDELEVWPREYFVSYTEKIFITEELQTPCVPHSEAIQRQTNICRYFDTKTRFAYIAGGYNNDFIGGIIALADTPNRDFVEVSIYHKEKDKNITTYFGISPFLNAKRNITMF